MRTAGIIVFERGERRIPGTICFIAMREGSGYERHQSDNRQRHSIVLSAFTRFNCSHRMLLAIPPNTRADELTSTFQVDREAWIKRLWRGRDAQTHIAPRANLIGGPTRWRVAGCFAGNGKPVQDRPAP